MDDLAAPVKLKQVGSGEMSGKIDEIKDGMGQASAFLDLIP
ncbi:hypothetical protein CyaNS01_00629 [Cyanobium sp. NS01]|nr:hypothetical protein CyaNS01_00629 [Cyanobium sp. NS01]